MSQNTRSCKLYQDKVKTTLDRLFGGSDMGWKTVILFAAGTAVLTWLFLIIPIFKNTSFERMGVHMEAWVFFAVVIIQIRNNILYS